MAQIWSREQAELILKCLLFRAQTAPQKLRIKREGKEVKIDNIGLNTASDQKVYVVLDESDKRRKRIYFSLNDHSGHFYVERFFWQKKGPMELLFDKLMALTEPGEQVAAEALNKCFPECTTIEFEKFVLGHDKVEQ